MLSDTAERDQGAGVCERPAPAIEADGVAEQSDGFVAKRIGVEGRSAEAFEPLAAATPPPRSEHKRRETVRQESQLVGIALWHALLWNRRMHPMERSGNEQDVT